MNKRALIQKIIVKLNSELAVYFRAAQSSRAEATHESSKAENKYDTRGLEASYLARGQSKQAAEAVQAIDDFKALTVRPFGPGDGIDIGALVELSSKKESSVYFLGPRAGGTEVLQEKRAVLVITPQSPLGQQLVGRKAGEKLKLALAGTTQDFKIDSIS